MVTDLPVFRLVLTYLVLQSGLNLWSTDCDALCYNVCCNFLWYEWNLWRYEI